MPSDSCTKPADIGLVIFDCDGVVVDSEILSANVLIDMVAELGVNIDPPYVYNNFLGRSFPTVSKHLRDQFSLDLPANFEERYREVLLRRYENKLKPIDGIPYVLSQLNVPFCLASSSSPERVVRSLEVTNLGQYFARHVFTASMVKNGKPAPDLFLHAANQFNVSPENCLVIEDSAVGLQAGVAAKMQVLWFSGGSHVKAAQTDKTVAKTHMLVEAKHNRLEHFSGFFNMFSDLRVQD